jgi:hypothetical protein
MALSEEVVIGSVSTQEQRGDRIIEQFPVETKWPINKWDFSLRKVPLF